MAVLVMGRNHHASAPCKTSNSAPFVFGTSMARSPAMQPISRADSLLHEGGAGPGLNLAQVLHFSRRAAAQGPRARGKAGPHSTLITRRASFSCQAPGDQAAPVEEGCTERQMERGWCVLFTASYSRSQKGVRVDFEPSPVVGNIGSYCAC